MKKIILVIILAGLMAGDIVTTNITLSYDGGVEYNPLLQPIVENVPLHIAIKILAMGLIVTVCLFSVRIIKKTVKSKMTSLEKKFMKLANVESPLLVLIVWFSFVNISNLLNLFFKIDVIYHLMISLGSLV